MKSLRVNKESNVIEKQSKRKKDQPKEKQRLYYLLKLKIIAQRVDEEAKKQKSVL